MNKFLYAFVLILGLIYSNKAEASHIAAADIYYDYLGPNYYKVHLIIYRDCSGISQSTTDIVCATSNSCNQTFNINMDTTGANDPLNGTYVDQLCPNVNSICNGGTFPGYQYFHLVGTTLGLMNFQCTDWQFVWNTCCRNNNQSVVAAGVNIFCALDNVNYPVNNSVRLLAQPIPYVCLNNQTVFQNLPYDPDGDSIYVYASPAMSGPACDSGNGLNYTAPLTYQQPLFVSSGYVVNPSTGTATFTPNTQGSFVLAFRADEYDKATGGKRAMVLRDVQIAVLNCASPPPAPIFTSNVTGGIITSTSPPAVTVCPGSQLVINAMGVSQSGSNSLFAYANNQQFAPTSTFSANPPNGGNDTVYTTFTWTPTAANIGNHILLITFADSTCTNTQPIVLKSYLTINITVLPGVTGGGPYTYCPGGTPAQMYATGPGTVQTWLWTDINGNTSNIGLNSTSIQNPQASPNATTQYIVTGLPAVSGCANSDTVDVFVFPKTIVDAGPNKVICANESVVLNGTASAAGSPVWLPNYGISSSFVMTPTVNPLVDTTYVLTFTDINNCVFKDSVKVDVNGIKAILDPIKSEDNICPGVPFQLFANATAQPCGYSQINCTGNVDSTVIGTGNTLSNLISPFSENYINGTKIQYLYTANELKAAGIRPGNIKQIGFNVTSKAVGPLTSFNINMGCTSQNQLDAATGFVTGTTSMYFNPLYNSQVGMNMFTLNGDGYFWDGTKNIIIELCYTPQQGLVNSGDYVEQSNYNYITSMMEQSTIASSCNLVFNSLAGGSVSPSKPNLKVIYCKAGDYNFAWSPAVAFDTATVENPNSSNGVANTTTFTVTAVSSTNANCINTATVTLNIDNTSKIDAFVNPNYICEPGTVALTSLVTGLVPKYDCGEENVPCIAGPSSYYMSGPVTDTSSISPFQGGYRFGRSQMLYTAAELSAAGMSAGNIQSISFNIVVNNAAGAPYRNMYVKMGCLPSSITTLNSYYDYFKLKEVYYNPNYYTQPGNNVITLTTPFLWDGTSNLIVDLCYDNAGQQLMLNDVVSVYTTPTVQYLNDAANVGTNLCEYPYKGQSGIGYSNTFKPEIEIIACPVKPKTFEYVWQPPFLIFDSSAQTTNAYVTQTTIYTVSSVTGSKCPVSDTVMVTLLEHDLQMSIYDTSVCLGDAIQVYAYGSGSSNVATYDWSPTTGLSCSTCYNPVIQPTSTTTYTVIRTDSYGCKDTQQVIIRVNSNPTVSIFNELTGYADTAMITYGESIGLTASGPNLSVYAWSPAWGLSNPNFNITSASPTEPTKYYVYAKDSSGCRAIDSVYIKINYRDSVALPNVFSPNNDGKNDVFKIINLSFKSVQEFRVFNRWGQEVFTAKDNNGWDGTSKGKKCDVGTYHYLIRIAYPDGYTRILTGDVTLLN